MLKSGHFQCFWVLLAFLTYAAAGVGSKKSWHKTRLMCEYSPRLIIPPPGFALRGGGGIKQQNSTRPHAACEAARLTQLLVFAYQLGCLPSHGMQASTIFVLS